MKLYLMQHSEAYSKENNPERPLTEQGKADVERLAILLKNAGVKIELVICSEKLRARQTAMCLRNTIAPDVEIQETNMINPNDNPKAFDWQSNAWSYDTLVVGHLPFMARLVSHLLVDDVDRMLTAYKPGGIVCLERTNGEWQLNWMVTPELIP